MKKVNLYSFFPIAIALVLVFLITGGFYFYKKSVNNKTQQETQIVKPVTQSSPENVFGNMKPIVDSTAENIQEPKPTPTPVPGKNNPFANFINQEPINIMLLGIDRRSRSETSYRTDIMILASINPKTNKVVLISIPRDLWTDYGRVNAAYISGGWEALAQEFNTITGLNVTRFILTDFKDFEWIVDAMGGVEVNVERSFTDSHYPVDETLGIQTVEFDAGEEKMDGERALVFARSRKGDNGEGSDWARMKRQHLLLQGMVKSIQTPGNLFTPMNVENAFKTVTEGKMDTNLKLEDAYYLWDFYKDHDKYSVTSLILDENYVYNPPMEDYGGAWVVVPTDPTYAAFKQKVNDALGL